MQDDVRSAPVGTVRRVTAAGLAANLLLSATKLVIGRLTGSRACLADGIHSLSDTATDLALLVGVPFWSAPADERHPHGHQRIETLVACAIGLVLGVSGLTIAWQAIASIGEPGPLPSTGPVLLVAVFSIFMKEILYRWMATVGTRLHSKAMVANAWHHRSDALSSVPVAASAVVGMLSPRLLYVDQVAAVVVCLMLLRAAYGIVSPSLAELSDAGAGEADRKAILRLALEVDGVMEVHGLRTRRLGPGYAVDLHILVRDDMSVDRGHAICEEVTRRLEERGPRVIDVLAHLEPYHSESDRDC